MTWILMLNNKTSLHSNWIIILSVILIEWGENENWRCKKKRGYQIFWLKPILIIHLPPAKAGVNWFGANWSWLVDIETIELEINWFGKIDFKVSEVKNIGKESKGAGKIEGN